MHAPRSAGLAPVAGGHDLSSYRVFSLHRESIGFIAILVGLSHSVLYRATLPLLAAPQLPPRYFALGGNHFCSSAPRAPFAIRFSLGNVGVVASPLSQSADKLQKEMSFS